MSTNILYLLCFSLCIPAAIILLYIYSIYLNKKDVKLKEMLFEVAYHEKSVGSDAVFVLEKSFAALCFMCILPLSAIGFLSSILLVDHSFWKTAGYMFAFIMTIVGSVSVFCDYFLSMIIIVNGNMYIKCVKTLFRPVIVKLDGAYRYEDIPVGLFGLYSSTYMVSISMPSGSYMVTNANNKSQLRNTLNHINSALIDGRV